MAPACAMFALSSSLHGAPKVDMPMPDFTKGDAIPAAAKHDWNLGATGLRGWMFTDKMVTSDARQIAITQVDPGSPADGLMQVGDVILGVNEQPVHEASNPLWDALEKEGEVRVRVIRSGGLAKHFTYRFDN